MCVECIVRGYFVYKDDWMPDIGDRFDGRIDRQSTFKSEKVP